MGTPARPGLARAPPGAHEMSWLGPPGPFGSPSPPARSGRRPCGAGRMKAREAFPHLSRRNGGGTRRAGRSDGGGLPAPRRVRRLRESERLAVDAGRAAAAGGRSGQVAAVQEERLARSRSSRRRSKVHHRPGDLLGLPGASEGSALEVPGQDLGVLPERLAESGLDQCGSDSRSRGCRAEPARGRELA